MEVEEVAVTSVPEVTFNTGKGRFPTLLNDQGHYEGSLSLLHLEISRSSFLLLFKERRRRLAKAQRCLWLPQSRGDKWRIEQN